MEKNSDVAQLKEEFPSNITGLEPAIIGPIISVVGAGGIKAWEKFSKEPAILFQINVVDILESQEAITWRVEICNHSECGAYLLDVTAEGRGILASGINKKAVEINFLEFSSQRMSFEHDHGKEEKKFGKFEKAKINPKSILKYDIQARKSANFSKCLSVNFRILPFVSSGAVDLASKFVVPSEH